MNGEKELNISLTSSENEMPTNEVEVTSKVQTEEEEKMVETILTAE